MASENTQPKLSRRRLADIQRFSRGVGGVLVLITVVSSLWNSVHAGFAPMLTQPVVAGIGFVILALGVAAPATLDVPERLWMKLAHFLGYWNTRILLTLVFYLLLLPVGLLARLFGWDKLRLHKPSGETFYQPAPEYLGDTKHFEHPF